MFDLSSSRAHAFWLYRACQTARLDSSRLVERVESCRDVTCRDELSGIQAYTCVFHGLLFRWWWRTTKTEGEHWCICAATVLRSCTRRMHNDCKFTRSVWSCVSQTPNLRRQHCRRLRQHERRVRWFGSWWCCSRHTNLRSLCLHNILTRVLTVPGCGQSLPPYWLWKGLN